MARRPTDDALHARLPEIAAAGLTGEGVDGLRDMLRRKSSVLVSNAARVAATLNATELISDLRAGFARLLDASYTADEGCLAKCALVEALDTLGLDDPAPFLLGVQHVQMEPAFEDWKPTRLDAAAGLRAECAFALARIGGREGMLAIAALLTDAEPAARIGATKAAAHRGGFEAELLLRVKASVGDAVADVTAECLTGLMGVQPERSLRFVAGFLLSSDQAVAEAAALALGESREVAALPVLWDHRASAILSDGVEEALLLAVALSRRDEGVDYLLDVVADDSPNSAARAVAALRIYAHDEGVTERLRAAVANRGASVVSRAFSEHFEQPGE